MEIRPEYISLITMLVAVGGLLLTSRNSTRASAADIAKLQVSIDNLQRDVSSLRIETSALRDNSQGAQASIVYLTGLAEHNREEVKLLRERVRSLELERRNTNEED